MADDGLELNLVSDPSAASAPPSRSKKRGGGKAWAKKKKKQPSQAQADQQPHDTSADKVRTGSRPPTTTTTTTTAAQVAPPAGIEQPAGTRPTAKSMGGQDGGRKNDTSNTNKAARSPHHPADTNTPEAAEVASGSARRVKPRPGADAPSQGGSGSAAHRSPKVRSKPEAAASGDSAPKELSNERRRVLEMAGRGGTTTPKGSRGTPGGEEKRSGTKRATPSSSTSLSSSARATKRKRPAAGAGSPGPVSSDGVIDFTGGDATPSKKVDPKRPDKNRKALATAAAVAKATAAMAKAGGRWWDDDDDDHVVKAKASSSTPASSGGWGYGAGGGGGGGYGGYGAVGQSGEEVEEDKDGGLPSDIHPNSVRTKAVDMGGEASKAMQILSALMESGGSVAGALGGSQRVKNGGKSKKKAKEPAEPEEGHSTATPEPSGVDAAVVGTRVVGVVGGAKADAEGEQSTVPAPEDEDTAVEDIPPTEPTAATAAATPRPATAAAGSSSGGSGSGGGGAENVKVIGSRKQRGRLNTADDGDSTGGTTVPLPEHHARPRELSRRAAAKPLASARSTHVMAVGPGATFAALNLPPKMVSHLEEPKGDLGGGGMGLAGPTVCQLASVPVLAAGHNTVVKSETGSGKTLAYLLPMLCDLAAMEPRVEREKGTLAIVLAPTRELSAQILEVLTKVVRPFIWLVPGSISGGERRKSEKARLRKGVTILVCTPGRLLDHLKTTKCFRRDLMRWLILDEADRLLDMGFEKQVKEIVELLDQSAKAVRSGPAGGTRVQGGVVVPSIKVIKRQTVMVSATLEKGVSRLAAVLLSKHMRVDTDSNFVESVDESGKATLISGERGAPKSKSGTSQRTSAEEFSTPRQLVQYYMTVTQKLRLPALCSFLRARAREKVVVFMATCDAVDFHHDLFRRAGWPGDAPPPSAASAGTDGQGGLEGVAGEGGRQGVGQGGVDGGGAGGGGAADKSGKKKAGGDGDSGFFGAGCLVRRLHGNVPQTERQATYRAFGAAKSGVLICTDVAARGLDLPTVDWIVQYDPPAETADYVHRVGRTARKGERGHSLLFLLPREAAYLGVLEARGLRPKPLSLEGVLCAADAGKRDARRADEQLAYELQQGLQLLVAGEKSLLDRARAAFQSHVRAYAARAPDSRAVFQVRSLHLGHVARSFALKDPPTAVKVGKRVVRRPGYVKGRNRGGDSNTEGGGGEGGERGEKRRRDGAGGSGGSVHRLGLSKQTALASRAEFL